MTIAANLRAKGTEKDASVVIGGTRYDLPMRRGTLGPNVVDVSTLYHDTGLFTYDRGSPPRQAASRRSRSSTSRRGSYSIAGIRSKNSPRTAPFLRPVTSCSTASYRPLNNTRHLKTASLSTRWRMSR